MSNLRFSRCAWRLAASAAESGWLSARKCATSSAVTVFRGGDGGGGGGGGGDGNGGGGDGGGGSGGGVSESFKNEFLIFKKNSNDYDTSNTHNNKYIELDASENHMLNISDINNNDLHIELVKEKVGLKGGNRKKAIKGSRKISIEPSYNKDSILNNSKIYKLTKL